MARSRRRSELARQRRWTRRLVRRKGFQDRELSESVNLLGAGDVAAALQIQFGSVWVGALDEFTRGEILSNSKGTGTLQKWDDYGEEV